MLGAVWDRPCVPVRPPALAVERLARKTAGQTGAAFICLQSDSLCVVGFFKITAEERRFCGSNRANGVLTNMPNPAAKPRQTPC